MLIAAKIFEENFLIDKVVSLMRQLPFTPQEDSWYSFLLEAEGLRTIVRLNLKVGTSGIRRMEKLRNLVTSVI
jgi:hypothetical protein